MADPQSNQLVCKLDDILKEKAQKKAEDLKQNLNEKINQISADINEKKENIQKTITDAVSQVTNKKDEVISNVVQTYQRTPIAEWRSARPDLTLLIEITIIVGILIVLYSIWPHLSAARSTVFSKEQYLKAAQLPESAYSIDELSKIKVELKALKDYFDHFESNPFSPENQGLYDLNRGVIFLPIISFVVIYIVPPFVILYIIWFIITYWRYVINALWGWFVMLYRFGSTLAECKLAEKWYIRMVTGWSECSPNFSDYFNAWKREYVDIPVYYERLRYVQEYYAAKQRYYTIPKRYYIDIPRERYQVKMEYLRKVYVDRAVEVFLKKLVDWYHLYYELPRDELYRYLLRSNQNLAAVWARVHQTQRQIRGLPYESTTPTGAKCTCPATPTPVKIMTNIVSDDINLVKDDLKTASEKVKQLYDDISKVREKQKEKLCETADNVVKNRNYIYFGIILMIILFFILIYGYSKIYGTPAWFYRLTGPTWHFAMVNLRPMLVQRSWDYSLYFVIVLVLAIIGYGLYRVRSWGPT